jgi:hypothetical protein
MKIEKLFLIMSFLLLACRAYAQEKDFGMWYEVNAEKKYSKHFELTGTATIRTFSNASLLDQTFVELGGTYNLNKYLGFAASYRLGKYLDKDYYYHVRHKWFADVKGTLPIGHLYLSLRARMQITNRTWVDDPSTDEKGRYDGRLRLKALYRTSHFPLNPYVSFETFSPMFRATDYFVTKSRGTAGAEYKFSKHHTLAAEYIYQRDETPEVLVMSIGSIVYTFRF